MLQQLRCLKNAELHEGGPFKSCAQQLEAFLAFTEDQAYCILDSPKKFVESILRWKNVPDCCFKQSWCLDETTYPNSKGETQSNSGTRNWRDMQRNNMCCSKSNLEDTSFSTSTKPHHVSGRPDPSQTLESQSTCCQEAHRELLQHFQSNLTPKQNLEPSFDFIAREIQVTVAHRQKYAHAFEAFYKVEIHKLDTDGDYLPLIKKHFTVWYTELAMHVEEMRSAFKWTTPVLPQNWESMDPTAWAATTAEMFDKLAGGTGFRDMLLTYEALDMSICGYNNACNPSNRDDHPPINRASVLSQIADGLGINNGPLFEQVIKTTPMVPTHALQATAI